MIAVDSSVLIDLLGGDVRAEASEDSLRQALARGPVVVCDVVVSEVVAGLGFGAELFDVLEEAGIGYLGHRGPCRGSCRRDAAPLQTAIESPKAASTSPLAPFPIS